jgi:hypothetical protein
LDRIFQPSYRVSAKDADQASLRSSRYLKQRGMLDESVLGAESHRTSYRQGKLTKENYAGRDHHPQPI